MKLVKMLFLGLFLVCLTGALQAQSGGNLLASKDLSTVKVDALTDAEVAQIQAQLKQAGVTIDMVESQAIAKGMSPAEFAKLKTRLSSVKASDAKNFKSPLSKKTSKGLDLMLDTDSLQPETNNLPKINPLIYGSELFSQNNAGYSANQNMATPINYIVGPNDVLKLVIYGVQEFSSDLNVSKEAVITKVKRVFFVILILF